MSFFTYGQDQALKELFSTIIQNNDDPQLIKLITDNDLIAAVGKDIHTECVVEEVLNNAENEDIDLTRDQALQIAYAVITGYDESDYQTFINTKIHEHLRQGRR